jgi:hypothetical protein
LFRANFLTSNAISLILFSGSIPDINPVRGIGDHHHLRRLNRDIVMPPSPDTDPYPLTVDRNRDVVTSLEPFSRHAVQIEKGMILIVPGNLGHRGVTGRKLWHAIKLRYKKRPARRISDLFHIYQRANTSSLANIDLFGS